MTAETAIKKYCVECSGFSKTEASRCPADQCPLWSFRPVIKKTTSATTKSKKGAKK